MAVASPADPFAAVAALPGVPSAVAGARDAVDGLLRHPAMRRGAGEVAARVAVTDARASAELADDEPAGAVLQGALRVAGELAALAGTWRRSPLQVLARLHVLAGRGLVPDAELGRPRDAVPVAERLQQLADLAVAPTRAPGVVVAAVVHGEVLALQAFGAGSGVVARAAERVVLVASGVDRAAVCAASIGHLVRRAEYGDALRAYGSGRPDGVAVWVRHCALAVTAGADEGLRIASEVGAG